MNDFPQINPTGTIQFHTKIINTDIFINNDFRACLTSFYKISDEDVLFEMATIIIDLEWWKNVLF